MVDFALENIILMFMMGFIVGFVVGVHAVTHWKK